MVLGPLIALLFMSGALCTFFFFRFQPDIINRQPLKIFNWTIIGVLVMLCIVWSLGIRSQLSVDYYDHKWIKPVIIAGCLALVNGFFGIGFLLRNFWIFKGPRTSWKQGGGLFD